MHLGITFMRAVTPCQTIVIIIVKVQEALLTSVITSLWIIVRSDATQTTSCVAIVATKSTLPRATPSLYAIQMIQMSYLVTN